MGENLIDYLAQGAFEEWRKKGEDLPNWEAMPEEAKTYFRGIAMAVFSRLADALVASLSPEFYALLMETRKEGKEEKHD